MSFQSLSASLAAHPLYTFIAAVLGYGLAMQAIRSGTRKRNPKNLPLPPGPKGYPIIGNLFDVPQPKDKPWIVYDQWSRKMNWGYDMAFLPYGQWWRRHRKAFNEHFHHNIVNKYHPIQLREVRALLNRLLISPEGFMHHLRHTFASTIMSVAYGITVEDSSDPYISNAEEALNGLVEAAIPGAFLVDLIPALLYVPAWFPGAGFKKKAAYWSKINDDVINKPFEYIENELKNGKALVPSVATSLIERLPEKRDPLYSEERQIAQNTAAVAYIGGADTTVSTAQTFFLAMALYPEVQRKAQAELDIVVGPHRLPDFSDRDSLPYINAVVKESMRWNQVAPLAIGHMSTVDDEYDGYFIPQGTVPVVLGNSWSILHDPEVFSNPMEYVPERYLKDGKLDPNARQPECAAFGYGRRICPGRHLSDDSLYLIIASVLSVYNIKPPIDELGNPLKLEAEFTSGFLS
uniref:O-methylsterigmatocystin oxidoreductase n=1 Tax=Psilocybe cubensis TaxID=181762 RepID=A0A8H7YBL7_PSICU